MVYSPFVPRIDAFVKSRFSKEPPINTNDCRILYVDIIKYYVIFSDTYNEADKLIFFESRDLDLDIALSLFLMGFEMLHTIAQYDLLRLNALGESE